MSDSATALLTIFADEWQAYQNAVSAALAPLAPEQLALQAAPGLRSVGELACHIIGSRAGWFSWVLDAGDENFKAHEQWHKPAPGSAP
ncbi:MAG TPA: DinB family protein, partial [Ktedonobacterales bacterium]|nr:DinB family protein [Ktedonobacterales bacterium]